ncbi:NADH-ubiquinone/plastoquinone oxidoreductase, chain 3 family protein [Mycobacterium xenopi 4042]|uniref:NADH-quinone oxidoreductase subunit n=1 Tax=Mycobacterium xenopi 4042 TaxID=1299334 RepID=X7Z310_MYCXE|nr:NADH-ubiquinone/plastoquinone oxidoreductase, chain 3 family protein [Mycobacterium xenopi 4042]
MRTPERAGYKIVRLWLTSQSGKEDHIEGAASQDECLHTHPGPRGIATAFAVFSVIVASVVGPSRYNRAKLEAYECGIEPPESSPARTTSGHRFPVKYYLTAMLFIVFDIEIVFLYPWRSATTRWGYSRLSRWWCSCSPCWWPTRTYGAAAG